MSIYDDSIETRIARIKQHIASRDYEGDSTVLTSDLVEMINHIENIESIVLTSDLVEMINHIENIESILVKFDSLGLKNE